MADTYRPSARGGSSYKPRSPRARDRGPPRDDRPRQDSSMYRFGDSNPHRPDDAYSYRPSEGSRDSYYPPRDNSYGGGSRRDQRDDFTFRSGQAPAHSYPIDNDTERPQRRRKNFNRVNPNWKGHGGKYNVAPHERALFQPRGSTPEQMLGMNEGPTKFLTVGSFSASEDEEQEGSAQSASEEGDGPTHKRSRTAAKEQDDGSSMPKWSNPDPYTVVPGEDVTKRKRKDIVQLIRKSKISAAEAAAQTNAVADNDDFISLDDAEPASQVIPTGPSSFSHRNHFLSVYPSNAPGSAVEPINARSLGPPPSLPKLSTSHHEQPTLSNTETGFQHQELQRIQGPRYVPAQEQRPTKRKYDHHRFGDITSEWQPTAPHGTTAPWTVMDHSRTEDMGHWLSKEIHDFHQFVKPHDFERTIRNDLYQRVQACLVISRHLPKGTLHCFGSYAAGLYLPTADMDLVYISDVHLEGGPPMINAKAGKLLSKIRNELIDAGLANNCEVIPKAKVPIIKFVDRETGIKVDISFEKVDGLTTQDCFEQWKREFPIMPALVTLVKQFLVMRGLSEVRDGNLGGFSVICLVVHMLYLVPGIQSENMVPEEHLGQLFMEFLELYGKKFNLATTIISMNPPIYLKKGLYNVDGRLSKPDNLTIIDPNQPTNNISGGSNNVKVIFGLFAQAHDKLQKRMAELQSERSRFGSILEVVFEGNYNIYLDQRAHLKSIHEAYFTGGSSKQGHQLQGHQLQGHQNQGQQNSGHQTQGNQSKGNRNQGHSTKKGASRGRPGPPRGRNR
ncbi:uncharacterized protein BDZ99DRAFT_188465 [Mytilinidion resinicola]|uniref:polynucleotide adenylyltransferase n=1 Tax=Mytilinidion resinicola TaxID=574789 RepID=A0A6A6Z3W9_9PEZI|nr:uncharacterized protein BDZ99DRAFT_188465 [Mytilinidion resinicola]KAF2814984.1 hypothetical protein BDZ99DRAFT_188465 [Mytilinidion resinicola]